MYFIVYYYSDSKRYADTIRQDGKKVSDMAVAIIRARRWAYFSCDVELWQFFKNEPPKKIIFC